MVITERLLVKVAERFTVLGQTVRLRLIEHLAGGAATPQELADALGLSQQNVSKHLQVLYRSGLVTRRREGSNVIYALRDASTMRLLDEVVTDVAEHLRDLSRLAANSAKAVEGHEHSDGRADESDV